MDNNIINNNINKIVNVNKLYIYDNNINNNSNDTIKKTINIQGTNNRYLMKKILDPQKENKNRVITKEWNLDDNLEHSAQLNILCEIKNYNYNYFNENTKIMVREIEKKISNYKQQDIENKKLCLDKFITKEHVIDHLLDKLMVCHYCKEKIFVLYKIVREHKQWSIDRLNNDFGHNNDNYVLACLECNLKRRRQNSEKFLFTKQLKIIKNDN